jgi:hypothetical protein
MDEHLSADSSDDILGATGALIEETSTEFLGRWNRLVSTTNWEKGRIIAEWRQRLIESEAPAQTYSDEAWSRWVGNVSGQHAGRLRRAWDRFGQNYQQFEGLYWSHFQAALDWDDAEMYLEGAVQSGWSVAQMRAQRWEAMGSPADEEPHEQDVVTAELDEDAPPVDATDKNDLADGADSSEELDQAEGSDFDPDAVSEGAPFDDSPEPIEESDSAEPAAPVRPFEDLPPLPEDLNDAFEALKIAILSHKLSEWQEVSRDEVLAHLDALKVLTTTEQ